MGLLRLALAVRGGFCHNRGLGDTQYVEANMHRSGLALPARFFFLLILVPPAALAEVPWREWYPQAPPLPPARGEVIRVTNVAELFQAARDVAPGGTILMADGHYDMPRYFELRTDDVTLRSGSGRRDGVVLDGARSQHGELVGITGCRGVVIADLTIQNVKWNGFKINSNLRATHVTIRNCVIHNVWQRGVKGPAVDEQDRGTFWPTACRIEYCLFYNDRPKSYADDATDRADTFGGNYIGGIDAMHARQWVIADNVFVGIHGRTGEGRGVVFLWNESRDCVVERNIVIDCDCGICLGNHYRHPGTRWHADGCVVRNNFVTRCGETGLLAAHTRDCRFVHNTVHDPESRLGRLIWALDENDGLLVAHNLLSGPGVLDTGSSEIVQQDNVARPDLAKVFVDPVAGNLRLTAEVPRAPRLLELVTQDIDGQQRPPRPMTGAHEFSDAGGLEEPPSGEGGIEDGGGQSQSGAPVDGELSGSVTKSGESEEGAARSNNEADRSEPLAVAYAPRVLAPGVADAYSLRTFGEFDRWRELAGDARASEIYRYLADTRTGLFHMNVVAEGDDGLSEFVQVRDPVKIINVYGYAYCGILGPVMAGVCEGVGLGPARTIALPAWNHVAAEAFYGDRWHYLDLDVRAVFRRPDGRLASLAEARADASLWRERGPLFFPNDSLDATRAIYERTDVQNYHGFQQAGHTMDFVLRPGERFTRWWQPQGGRWHHLRQYDEEDWLGRLLETPPRGPKPNHRHFSVHNHGNGLFVYEPQLSAQSQDFRHGVYQYRNVKPGPEGLVLARDGSGEAIFEVRSPYVIVPQVGRLDTTQDDREAALLTLRGRHVTVELSVDSGLTWTALPWDLSRDTEEGTVDLTPWVGGRYGYLLKVTLQGRADEAGLRRLRISTWVQVAPASLPALKPGRNAMKFVTGDHYGLPTRVVETRTRASDPEQLLKYLVAPPQDYDPQRKTARIRGTITARVSAPPGTAIAWFTATAQFATHQQESARDTKNRIAYSVNEGQEFYTIYESNVPTYTNHWHYNAAQEVRLDTPADTIHVRFTGDPALNNFAVYAHCLSLRPHLPPPVTVTHVWKENDVIRQAQLILQQPGDYEVTVDGDPINESVELAIASVRSEKGEE